MAVGGRIPPVAGRKLSPRAKPPGGLPPPKERIIPAKQLGPLMGKCEHVSYSGGLESRSRFFWVIGRRAEARGTLGRGLCSLHCSSEPFGPTLGCGSGAELHGSVGYAVDERVHPGVMGKTGIEKIQRRRSWVRSAMQEGACGVEGLSRRYGGKKGAVADGLELAGLENDREDVVRKLPGSESVENYRSDGELSDQRLVAGLRLDNFGQPEGSGTGSRWCWSRQHWMPTGERLLRRKGRSAHGDARGNRRGGEDGRPCERKTSSKDGKEAGQGVALPISGPT